MDFFGVLALILLTLVGYSCGAVIAGREKNKPLGLFDFGMAVLILALALATRSILGRWLAIAIWFILAGLGSALLRKVRYKDRRTEDRASESYPQRQKSASCGGPGMGGKPLLQRWGIIRGGCCLPFSILSPSRHLALE